MRVERSGAWAGASSQPFQVGGGRATGGSRLNSCDSADARERRRLWASRRRAFRAGRLAGRQRQASLRALPARRVPTLRSAGRDVTRAAWRA